MFFSIASSFSFMILNSSLSLFSYCKIKASSLAFSSALSSCSPYSHLLFQSSSLYFRASSKFWSLLFNSASMYSSLSCNWSLNCLSISSISYLMVCNKVSIATLLLRSFELSPCSGWTCLTLGEKVSIGLTLLCPCGSSSASSLGWGCCIPLVILLPLQLPPVFLYFYF